MSSFFESMNENMNYCIPVKVLSEILNELVAQGKDDYNVSFRIGSFKDSPGMALTFPICDIVFNDANQQVVLKHNAPCKECDGRMIPTYDLAVDIKDDNMIVNFEEILYA